MLYIVENDIGVGEDRFHDRPGHRTAGLHGGGNARLPAQLCQGAGELWVRQGLAAGDGEPAVRAVKEPVSGHLVEGFARCHGMAHDAAGLGGTAIHTAAAGSAERAVGVDPVGAVRPAGDRLLGTGLDALAAAGTLVRKVHELGRPGLGLRVGAPQAPQGAALDKHVGPDAGPVVDAVVLDVEHGAGDSSESFRHGGHSFPSCGGEAASRLPRLILA